MHKLQQLEDCRKCEFFKRPTLFCEKAKREIKGMKMCKNINIDESIYCFGNPTSIRGIGCEIRHSRKRVKEFKAQLILLKALRESETYFIYGFDNVDKMIYQCESAIISYRANVIKQKRRLFNLYKISSL